MNIAGKTWNNHGELINVFECKKHNNRSTSDFCSECDKENEMQIEFNKDDFHEEEAENGLI